MAPGEENGAGAKAGGGLFAVGLAALAVVCCAALPLIVWVVGGLSLAALLGVGGGAALGVLLVGLGVLALRARRRRCAPRPAAPASDIQG